MIQYTHPYGGEAIHFFYPDLHKNWYPVVLPDHAVKTHNDLSHEMLEWLKANAKLPWMPVFTTEYVNDPVMAGLGGSKNNKAFVLVLFRSKADAALCKMLWHD